MARNRSWWLMLVCALLWLVPVTAQERVTVSILVGLGTGTSPTQIEQQNVLAERFNNEQDKITLEFLIVPFEDAQTRLIAMLAGDTAPQLVGPMGVSTVADVIEAWTDITPLIEAEAIDMSDFYPAAVALNESVGKLTSLPLGLYPSFILYNKDMFDAAGVEYPPTSYDDTTWTLDRVRETAILLTLDGNGNNPTSPDFNADDIVQWGYDDSFTDVRGRLAQWGAENVGRPTSADYRTAVANSPEWIEGMQWYSDGIWVDYFIPGRPENSSQIESTGFGSPLDSGLIAMFQTHSWYLSEIRESMPELDFEIGLAPVALNKKDQRIARINSDVFAIPAMAEHQQEAWEVMKWLTSPENIVEVCLIYGCIPSRQSVIEDYNARLSELYPDFDLTILYDAIPYLDIPSHEAWVPEVARVNDTLEFAVSRIQTGDSTDAAVVLEEANLAIQALLDAYWASK